MATEPFLANQAKEITLLAFDFGLRHIGVAVAQSITKTATPVVALKAQQGQPDWNEMQALIQTWQPDLCVIGLPLNMDGTEQPMTQKARKFANRLHGRFGVQIALQDERLTTASAKEYLFEKEGFRGLQKSAIDTASACIIAESYLNQEK